MRNKKEERKKKILKILSKNELITPEISKKLKISLTTTLELLKELEKDGLVKKRWFGSWSWKRA
jgi:Mn-dependent DtxR family transcriptional regulator